MNDRVTSISSSIPESPTLETCATEPIHIPGAIQPAGALMAFDNEGVLTHVSANAMELLGEIPVLGARLDEQHLVDCPIVHQTVAECYSKSLLDGVSVISTYVTIDGRDFDLVVHRSQDQVVAEFEVRTMSADDVSGYALKAHRAMLQLKRRPSEEDLLNVAVAEVRKLTGFDRVMAYRFRHDDSGDVVAEALADGLEPYLGRRYPASDIPAQARRLYVESTLRIISDVQYVPVPLLQRAGSAPLDMSHCILRSVSPIHVEYLTNIGVGASMSVSIVANGRLWGMLACHHMSARVVPYSIRMACDVLAQLLSSAVQELVAQRDAARIASAAGMRSSLLEDALHSGDLLANLAPHLFRVREVFAADGVFAVLDGEVASDGISEIRPEVAVPIVEALAQHLRDTATESTGDPLIVFAALDSMPEALRAALKGAWCGVMAMRFDSTRGGWLVALRKEEIETIRWGGKPDKQYKVGPYGPRLTPRGSFAEWRETVRGKSLPWTDAERHIGRQLASGLVRANNARMADADRVRNQFLAILGHDLRGPLHAVGMAAQMLQRGKSTERMVDTIVSSSTRMTRLVAHMLDLGRLQNGLGLALRSGATDLVALIGQLVDEVAIAQPGRLLVREMPSVLMADVDGDRVLQMLGNIVSNAIAHGAEGQPVELSLRSNGVNAVVAIRNVGEPIDSALLPALFDPFKRSAPSARNKTGMGLGLYIAHEIAVGHGGAIDYYYQAPHVVFEVRLPLAATA